MIERASPGVLLGIIMTQPLESSILVRRLLKQNRAKAPTQETADRFLNEQFFILWGVKCAEKMGGTDTMQLCVPNTMIAIAMEYGNDDLATFVAKIDAVADSIESPKFTARPAKAYFWQFLLFWRKHYLDPGKHFDQVALGLT